MFPDGVKVVIMTEKDYERNIGQLQMEKWELEDRLKAIENYIRKYDTNSLDEKTLCILNDILLSEKTISNNYSVALSEMSNDKLYKKVMNLFMDTKDIAREVYIFMYNKY
mgnify:CR=1 FL=1